MWKWARQKIRPSACSSFSPLTGMLFSQVPKRAKNHLFRPQHLLRDVLQAGERKMPGLGVLVEVAERANVGPQIHDRDMGRVFIAGVDDETEAEVVVKSEPLGFELVFGAFDRGV